MEYRVVSYFASSFCFSSSFSLELLLALVPFAGTSGTWAGSYVCENRAIEEARAEIISVKCGVKLS